MPTPTAMPTPASTSELTATHALAPGHAPAARSRRHLLTALAQATAAAAVGSLVLGACAALRPSPMVLPPPGGAVLLGEVHDNDAGHAWRLAWLDRLLARGDRPALVLEQLDRDDQGALDRARAELPPGTTDAGILLAALRRARPGAAPARPNAGWDWRHYEPFIERALRHGLPLVAANVGRDDARRVMREGLAALGFEPAVPEDLLAGLARTIEQSHCGLVDAALARRMALAQVARDQQMARAVVPFLRPGERGAVLLAGNGHVRNDLGVPRWLDAAARSRTLSIGVLEEGQAGPQATENYDRHVVVPPQPRPDPCAGMKPPAR